MVANCRLTAYMKINLPSGTVDLILKVNKSSVHLSVNINALWENLSSMRDFELTRDGWSHAFN